MANSDTSAAPQHEAADHMQKHDTEQYVSSQHGKRQSTTPACNEEHAHATELLYSVIFPEAFGTGIRIATSEPIPAEVHRAIDHIIEDIDAAISRFRADSLVSRMRQADSNGSMTFPRWCAPLFDFADVLYEITQRGIDPCVGEELGLLGYGPVIERWQTAETGTVSKTIAESDAETEITEAGTTETTAATTNAETATTGKTAGTATAATASHTTTWGNCVTRLPDRPTTLYTTGPVALDFGAFGKGFAVDRIAQFLEAFEWGNNDIQYMINAGGDLRIHLHSPAALRIGLEDPHDPSQALGIVAITEGSLCASSPSRRHWHSAQMAAIEEAHHLLDARTGKPVQHIAATWAAVSSTSTAQANTTQTAAVSSVHQDEAGAIQTTISNTTLAQQLAVHYPTMVADGLATSLFTTNANILAQTFAASMLALDSNNTISSQYQWFGELFTS